MAALVFACALLFRLAIPAGWMPSADADGFRITLCSGMGTADGSGEAQALLDAAIGHDGKSAPTSEGTGADQPCAFAGAAHALATPIAAPLILPQPPVHIAFAAPRPVAAPGRGLAAPPPPQTGPPILI